MKLVFQIPFALGFLLLALGITRWTWPAETALPSSRETVTECPRCRSQLSRSCVAEKAEDNVTLICTACGHKYPVPNSAEQQKIMTRRYGKPIAEYTVESIDQLGRGDVLLLKRLCIWNICTYYHSMLVTEVDRDNKRVSVAELTSGWLSFGMVDIRNVTMKFDKLRSKTLVYRFLPLDCLPLQETLDVVRSWTEKGAAVWGKFYNPFSGNCQHLAMDCKTGWPLSKDAIFYMYVFFLYFLGFAFSNPLSLAKRYIKFFKLICLCVLFPRILESAVLGFSEPARLYVIIYVFVCAAVLLILISRWLRLSEDAEVVALMSLSICAIILLIFMSCWLELKGDDLWYTSLSILVFAAALLFVMIELRKLRKDAAFYADMAVYVCALVLLISVSCRFGFSEYDIFSAVYSVLMFASLLLIANSFMSVPNESFKSTTLIFLLFLIPACLLTCKSLMLGFNEPARPYVIAYVFVFAAVLLILISRWLRLSTPAEVDAFVSFFVCAIILLIFMSWWLELKGGDLLYAYLLISFCDVVLLNLMIELRKLEKDAAFYAVMAVLICALVLLISVFRWFGFSEYAIFLVIYSVLVFAYAILIAKSWWPEFVLRRM